MFSAKEKYFIYWSINAITNSHSYAKIIVTNKACTGFVLILLKYLNTSITIKHEYHCNANRYNGKCRGIHRNRIRRAIQLKMFD